MTKFNKIDSRMSVIAVGNTWTKRLKPNKMWACETAKKK